LYLKILQILRKSNQQGYVNLIEGLKSFCEVTVHILGHDFYTQDGSESKNQSTEIVSDERGAPLRIASIK
jgi:hypothetical protein